MTKQPQEPAVMPVEEPINLDAGLAAAFAPESAAVVLWEKLAADFPSTLEYQISLIDYAKVFSH